MKARTDGRVTITTMARRLERWLLLASLVTEISCGSTTGVDPNICPNDVPDTCPTSTPVPTYAAQVAPLLHERCGACHTIGGMAAPQVFDTYLQVQAEQIGILSQLHNCLMPPADQPQPTPEDRQIIFTWIVCGAKND